MFRIAVCDGESECRELLVKAVKEFAERQKRELDVDIYVNASLILAAMDQGKEYELIFLDADLPGFGGIEFGKKLREERQNFRTEIVYLSGQEISFRDLIETGPLHFLEKPVDTHQVQIDIGKAMKKKEVELGVFCYHNGREQLQTEVKRICFFYSEGRRVHMIMEEGEACFYDRMDRLENQFSRYGFFRIHRGTLVNCRHIKRVLHDKVVMDNGAMLQISSGRKAVFQNKRSEWEYQKR